MVQLWQLRLAAGAWTPFLQVLTARRCIMGCVFINVWTAYELKASTVIAAQPPEPCVLMLPAQCRQPVTLGTIQVDNVRPGWIMGPALALALSICQKNHTPLSYSLSCFWSTSRQSANWTWMKAVRESIDLYLVFWYEEKGKAFLFLRDVSLSVVLSLSISLIPTFTKCITQQWLKEFDWNCSGCWVWRIVGPVYLDSEGKEGRKWPIISLDKAIIPQVGLCRLWDCALWNCNLDIKPIWSIWSPLYGEKPLNVFLRNLNFFSKQTGTSWMIWETGTSWMIWERVNNQEMFNLEVNLSFKDTFCECF